MRERAKIIARNGETIVCNVECGDACSACAARKVCSPNASAGVGDGKEGNLKTITLVTSNPAHKVGDWITVEITDAMGLRAVLLAYLIPVALIIGSLLVLQYYGVDDLWAGVIVLGVAVLYFLSIKIFGLARMISVEIVDDEFNSPDKSLSDDNDQ